ncbi:MAG: hypothetical protein AAGC60_03920 [Acidobacteriota bacterium]
MFVDDAHTDPSRISRIRAILRDVSPKTAIGATTWPGAEEQVRAELQVGTRQARRLEPLPASCILEIYRLRGLSEEQGVPPWVLRDLVDQASNLPGLAMTLAELCLQGNWEDVLSGQALRGLTVATLERLATRALSLPLLAALSVGGERGMPLLDVGQSLGLSKLELQNALSSLDSTGIVFESSENAVGVHPGALRSSFIEHVFFEPPRVFDIEDFIPLAITPREALRQLAEMASRCPKVDRTFLQSWLTRLEVTELDRMRSPEGDPWLIYATLGSAEARWVLEHYPGPPAEALHPALALAPSAGLERLLQLAESAEGPLHSQPRHPLRILEDWLRSRDQAIERRKSVLRAIRRRDRADRVAFEALCLVLDPSVEEAGSDALDSKVRIYFGARLADELDQIVDLWPAVLAQIQETTVLDWPSLSGRLEKWATPELIAAAEIPTESRMALEAGARTFVRDLRSAFHDDEDLQLGLHQLASSVDIAEEFPVDREIADLLSEPTTYEESLQQLDALASRWLALGPVEGSRRLVEVDRALRRIQTSTSYRVQEIAQRLADLTDQSVRWLDALRHAQSPFLTWPFAMNTSDAEFLQRYESWLEDEEFHRLALQRGLQLTKPPHEILELTAGHASIVGLMIRRGQIAEDLLPIFLSSDSPELRLEAAVGLWRSKGSDIAKSLVDLWEDALLSATLASSGQHSTVGEILSKCPSLGVRWLLAEQAAGDSKWSHRREDLASTTCHELGIDQRARLVESMERRGILSRVANEVVQRDPQLFSRLLERFPKTSRADSLAQPIACALSGRPDTAWLELARLAVESSVAPAAVVASAFGGGGFRWGTEVDYWTEWAESFRALAPQSDEMLQEVLDRGIDIATEQMERSLRHEKATALGRPSSV